MTIIVTGVDVGSEVPAACSALKVKPGGVGIVTLGQGVLVGLGVLVGVRVLVTRAANGRTVDSGVRVGRGVLASKEIGVRVEVGTRVSAIGRGVLVGLGVLVDVGIGVRVGVGVGAAATTANSLIVWLLALDRISKVSFISPTGMNSFTFNTTTPVSEPLLES